MDGRADHKAGATFRTFKIRKSQVEHLGEIPLGPWLILDRKAELDIVSRCCQDSDLMALIAWNLEVGVLRA